MGFTGRSNRNHPNIWSLNNETNKGDGEQPADLRIEMCENNSRRGRGRCGERNERERKGKEQTRKGQTEKNEEQDKRKEIKEGNRNQNAEYRRDTKRPTIMPYIEKWNYVIHTDGEQQCRPLA